MVVIKFQFYDAPDAATERTHPEGIIASEVKKDLLSTDWPLEKKIEATRVAKMRFLCGGAEMDDTDPFNAVVVEGEKGEVSFPCVVQVMAIEGPPEEAMLSPSNKKKGKEKEATGTSSGSSCCCVM
uniref:UBL3-like ubiquitin domain-containing protein n=1 Tax=Chromera velia CCMP2878 TaxID=1169474 RepID=A0A0G4I6S7_9ALVE|mmetsp:Transcript_52928/g.103511  ORF Transcript_52928/g.103511 Transcript_52928/m.103511 type:complete len:126 (+) Transcript_52928:274-651(+)|eukprot:Cvel_11460.t1-p1 / transcript=Cvel_11460.t1 / gene=Cvel_11460 / organism=Chromera_velia_CCMP2878 / gene_product=hypothetical protein / transcript_product=hypothetical protein / location=Cvel_scaffold721:31928-34876(-) / protein_length=125 / sequence_SO=supercontig / SO=protein_coding / is_pseudo=false